MFVNKPGTTAFSPLTQNKSFACLFYENKQQNISSTRTISRGSKGLALTPFTSKERRERKKKVKHAGKNAERNKKSSLATF